MNGLDVPAEDTTIDHLEVKIKPSIVWISCFEFESWFQRMRWKERYNWSKVSVYQQTDSFPSMQMVHKKSNQPIIHALPTETGPVAVQFWCFYQTISIMLFLYQD